MLRFAALLAVAVAAMAQEPVSDFLLKGQTWATGTIANVVVVLAIFALGVRYIVKSRGEHSVLGSTIFGCLCVAFARGFASFWI